MNIRHVFDEKLEELSTELIKMGAVTTAAIDSSMKALESGNKGIARQVIEGDLQINDMEHQIEQACLKLILRQQPVAGDLRKISAAMKMITDIERIGDAASDIAEISLHLPYPSSLGVMESILNMAGEAREMAAASIDSYVKSDLDLAKETRLRDDIVDDHYLAVRSRLAGLIRNNPEAIDEIMDYLMIIKYLERIGDHAVNICEWVEYSITGVHKNERLL